MPYYLSTVERDGVVSNISLHEYDTIPKLKEVSSSREPEIDKLGLVIGGLTAANLLIMGISYIFHAVPTTFPIWGILTFVTFIGFLIYIELSWEAVQGLEHKLQGPTVLTAGLDRELSAIFTDMMKSKSGRDYATSACVDLMEANKVIRELESIPGNEERAIYKRTVASQEFRKTIHDFSQ